MKLYAPLISYAGYFLYNLVTALIYVLFFFCSFQAGRVPWNLSHLVGSFQSPSSTSAGATSSEYAANQAVSAGGGVSAGSAGSLPHPLPHYSAHHYSSSPQTSAASYHQSDLAVWGGPGGGGAGGSNLGMHNQSSPLTSLTSVAMAAASAVTADSPSGSNAGTSVGGYAPTKMDPESLASMYYPHQVLILLTIDI